MPDRVHDDAVPTHEGTVVERGRTGRRAVRFPAETPLSVDTVIRLVLDGRERWVRPATPVSAGGLELRGAYDTATGARDPGGRTDRLRAWVADRGLEAGRTVHLDVVAEGYRYGLRGPGESATYDAGRPDTGLSDIAEDL